jgi:hypothetical protein
MEKLFFEPAHDFIWKKRTIRTEFWTSPNIGSCTPLSKSALYANIYNKKLCLKTYNSSFILAAKKDSPETVPSIPTTMDVLDNAPVYKWMLANDLLIYFLKT